MAETAVDFLLQNLKNLLLYNVSQITDVKKQLEFLYNDLASIKASLKDLSGKQIRSETLKEVEKLISDQVYEAEDVLDAFVVEAAIHKSRGVFRRIFHSADHSAKFRRLAESFQNLREKVKDIYSRTNFESTDLDLRQLRLHERSTTEAPIVEEENVVGFQDAEHQLMDRLMAGRQGLEVISIVGMGGLGKTTLAKRIFDHSMIKHHFECCSWVCVSQEYSTRKLALDILGLLGVDKDQMYSMLTESLIERVYKYLKGRRYLIVMDDVWTTNVWSNLRRYFPNDGNGSRILLTTRNMEVAWHANSYTYQLPLLSNDESWKLLQMKTFGSYEFPPNLTELGKKIADKCKGIPLAVVVCGQILRKIGPDGSLWEKFAESEIINQESPIDSVIAISFDYLPYNLRLCMLYFGMFPENNQIPVWKLICLWIAEGFVEQKVGVSLEDNARTYLDYFIDRSLVMVGERTSDGKVKTCQVHDLIHAFCKRRAEHENFFQEITNTTSGSSLNKCRRLCISSHILDYISSKPLVPQVRSFLCQSSEQFTLPLEHISAIPRAFKLLKVLDAKPIYFTRFPPDLTQLVHLRYLVLSGDFKILPAAISNLWNIQSLMVQTPSRTLEIKGDIWKMIQLRHLKTNASTCLQSPSSRSRKSKDDSSINANLQTLSMISPESCTEDVFARAPNLRKLGIRGHLAILLDTGGESGLFDSVGKLGFLERLKLLNDAYNPLAGLPEFYKFPPIKKLTLASTKLDWKHMTKLGRLISLEVLKLKDNAFVGRSWQPEEGGFPLLKVLHIESTDLVFWEASDSHFPNLRSLYLKDCSELERVPSGLADIPTLEKISLYHTTHTAVHSARKIQEEMGYQIQLSISF